MGKDHERIVFAAADAAWAEKDFPAVRREYAKALDVKGSPAHYRSYAQLRIAQSYQAEQNFADAKAEYEKIKADADYPEVHRHEAEECIREIDRMSMGLPARDDAASRTKITPVRPGMEFFVSPDGSDANSGRADSPFATLAKARDTVRALKAGGLPAGGVAVTLKSGEYTVTETLALTAEDSGTAASPIVYRAEKKGSAVLYGGRRLSGFIPVTDPDVLARLPAESRGNVYQCDLKSLGITDYGELRVRGMNQPPSPPTLELYFNGCPQTLARWPNEGFVGIRRLVAPGDPTTGTPSIIEYDGNRPERWYKAEDPWLFGYFRYLWADGTVRIASIDTAAKTLTTVEPYRYSNNGMDPSQGIIYHAFNLLEEIDQPGEWYLNRTTGVLYFWPPADPATAMIEIGMLSVPMLTLENAAHVRIEGLVFDLARFNCMAVRDSENCLITACTVKRFAGNGISICGGKADGIYGCDIHTIGRRATEVIGGDRKTLTPAGHFVENCRIHFFGRIDRTYTPAIQLEGVGNRVAHNLMYDCPSSVMRIEGNDHLIEYNEVFNAVQESDDQGAMELFYNPTYRGVVFRYNRFRDNGRSGSKFCGQAAIRFDDAISGMQVYSNIFIRSANGDFGAVQINSGRDNIIDNNIFADCRKGVSGGWRAGNVVWNTIREGRAPMNFHSDELYLSRYPAIGWMTADNGRNHVWRNLFYRCGHEFHEDPERLDLLANGVFRKTDPGFADAANGDFGLAPDAPLFETVGFKPIPAAEIGLYENAFRASWPVDAAPAPLPDWRICRKPDIQGDAELATTWQVFAPLSKAFPPPIGEQLLRVPEKLTVEGRELAPVAVEVKDGLLDLAGILGGTAMEKTAWIYIPFQTRKGGMNTFGFGADWWLQAWIDGTLVCDTTTMGNGPCPPSVADHMSTTDLAPGAHLIVIRFVSGSVSSLFTASGPTGIDKAWDESHWWAE
ncbi:MAG: right-handed parallel beta-helix repeat-containing protein [Victivallales bacterium]